MISHRHASPIEKTCPVVTRQHQGHCEILAFADPQAGHQFVKGTLEPSESAAAAARRELREEAGITEIKTTIVLGQSTTIHPGELWHFFGLKPLPCPTTGTIPAAMIVGICSNSSGGGWSSPWAMNLTHDITKT